MKSFYSVLQGLVLSAMLVASTACSKDKANEPGPTPPPMSANEEINSFVDSYLQAYYLWNEEYKTLTLNYDQPYDDFFTNALMSMKTNTFDKKMRNGYWQLYSYLQRMSSIGSYSVSTRGVGHGIQKEMYYGFGLMRFVASEYTTQEGSSAYALVVEGVYPGTPAAEAGIHRGSMIMKVNGKTLTRQNIQSYANTLGYPNNNVTVELTLDQENAEPVQITSRAIYENPVLCSKVIEQGDHKVGYLAYSSFEAAYDDDVLSAFELFKSAGVTDLILDLRLNGGGHVITAKMISTCIGGIACQGKVFQYYRYNDVRMESPESTAAQTDMTYDSSKKLFYENFAYDDAYFGVDLKAYALDLPRVYVIVSNGTASSSEAVIGSLKGVGVDVVLIGTTTNGKNVGMEPISFTTSSGQFYLCPITFQTYNAMEESVDPNGITPNYTVADWADGYSDFGETSDPCIAKAMTLITGEATASVSRNALSGLNMRLDESIDLPEARGMQGMVMLPREYRPEVE